MISESLPPHLKFRDSFVKDKCNKFSPNDNAFM